MNQKTRDLGPDAKIKQMRNAAGSDDGQNVMFEIVTADDKAHPFWTTHRELEKMIPYLINLSQFTASRADKLQAPTGSETITANPIEAIDLSVVPGRTPTEALVAIHLGTFVLTFALPAMAIYALQNAIAKMSPVKDRKPQ